MNLDSDIRIVGPGEFRYAENIRLSNSEGGDVGAIEKSLSNKQLTALNFTGVIDTVGSYGDEFEEKLYWAVKDDNGCYVVEYELSTETTSYVLQDTRAGAANVLSFDSTKLVQMTMIIDSDNGNRYLAFTDYNTEPKFVNVERAKTYGLNGFDAEDILLIKKPPIYAPTIVLGNTGNEENNMEERFLLFAYRYKYLDGEYSALSPYTQYGFMAKSFSYDYSIQSNESMVNNYNKVAISINTGSDLVTDVEVVFKQSGSNTLFSIETFNKADKSWGNDVTQSFDFENNKIRTVLPEDEISRLYDNVPKLAKSIANIGNRIVFGNYVDRFNLIDAGSSPVVSNLSASLVSSAITLGVATKSLKSIRDYEVAISYLDDYGRQTTPLTSENNTVYISNANCIKKNEIKVTIPHLPPAFATYYRFFIKQNRTDYDTIIPTQFYQDGVFAWIKLEGGDKDKVNEGDFLYVKADTQSILATEVQTKVLEKKDQPWNFLNPEETTDTLQLAGLYIKVKPQGYRMNEQDFTNYTFSSYDSSSNANDNPIRSEANVIEKAVYYGTSTTNDLTESGTYTGTTDIRYVVQIQDAAIASEGSVTLTGGASGSVDGITVNGVQIMSGAESFVTDLDTTALNVATNITAHTSTPNYNASAVGAVITITAVDVGNTPNGYAVVSSATTITTSDANMGTVTTGVNDTFRWSNDDGANWTAPFGASNVEITGAAQLLEDGVNVTFGTTTGHDIDDEWIVSAKCSTDDGFGANESSKAYAFFKSLESDGVTDISNLNSQDVIEGGARITIVYDEYNENVEYVSETYISSKRYANLEEWWFGDNIDGLISISPTRRWFRRGTLTQNGGAKYFTQTTTGDMTLIIKSSGTQNNDLDARVKINSTITIFQSKQNIILETKPIDENTDVYYEIGQTYQIVGGYHIGNGGTDVDQTAVVDAEITLPVFNCFAWGNGFESYKIRDEFNAIRMKMDTRPSIVIKDYKENHRIASLTWSGVFEQTTNYNALNEFNQSLFNFKDLDDQYGAIYAMASWDTDLDVWQEDKVHKVYYDKKVIYNQDGTTNLAATDDLFNSVISYAGEYGISTNGESLAKYGNYTYWADAKRGVVCRKGQSGIEIISNFAMRDWFRDAFRDGDNIKVLGCYDPYFQQYVISLNGYTLTFSEKLISGDQYVKGWTSFHSYLPDGMDRLNNRFFTIKDGELYLHNVDEGCNNFYNEQFTSKVTTVFNIEPLSDKVFKTIVTQSEYPWDVKVSTNFGYSTIDKNEFRQRESRWYAYVRKSEDPGDLRGRVFGIGEIQNVVGSIVTFTSVPNNVNIGDALYQLNGSNKELIGTISNINGGDITVSSVIVTPVIGRLSFAQKLSRIEGSEIRGYYAEVELEDSSLQPNELFAVTTNVVSSNFTNVPQQG